MAFRGTGEHRGVVLQVSRDESAAFRGEGRSERGDREEVLNTINEHEGSKYLRKIRSAVTSDSIQIDVYAVLEAFAVTCPARAHAIKKLLCAGGRGKGGQLADLIGADAAVSRAIELQKAREA